MNLSNYLSDCQNCDILDRNKHKTCIILLTTMAYFYNLPNKRTNRAYKVTKDLFLVNVDM